MNITTSEHLKHPLPWVLLTVGLGAGFLFAFFVFQTEEAVDPNAKYYEVELRKGMSYFDLERRFGTPDQFDEYWLRDDNLDPGNWMSRKKDTAYPYYYQQLQYGPFGAHGRRGDYTRYRLTLRFVDGKLLKWEKSRPVGGD